MMDPRYLTWNEWIAIVIACHAIQAVKADAELAEAVQAVCESAGVQW